MAGNSNSSDSDSSCDWTFINHEGSDIEMVNSEHGVANDNGVLVLQGLSFEHEEVQVLPGVNSQSNTTVMGEIAHAAVEETKSAVETEEETPFEDIIYFGTVSDDSDTGTLEPSKLEEVGIQEEAVIVEEAQSSENFHMASSFSSQYTFCQPEIAFSYQHNDDESSSDEIGHQPSPAEEGPPAEQEPEPCKENLDKRQFSSDLNKCVILALVIAISLEFGHICGTVQVLRHQQLVKNCEGKLSDMKDYISQCQQGQESFIDTSLKENLARCWTLTEEEKMSFESQQKTLATENVLTEKKEIETLRERLTELERKLILEQQRSDLWERLYVEAKDQIGKQEMDVNKKGSRGNQRAQKKSKETFLGSVKETFNTLVFMVLALLVCHSLVDCVLLEAMSPTSYILTG